ncbi:rnhA operon protein [Haloplanus litoreus]|uniref:RnhA operon protein n=1 Tax=Haloplanus litoreus TaxID=767515 RepID=A0ABD6A2H9_9EURY
MTDLPRDLQQEAERLTRLARRAVDENEAAAYERDRDDRLAAYDYTARVREADDTLVLHPAEWVDGDTAQLNRIEDTDRAVEISLSGSGDAGEWEAVEAHNADVVERVHERVGEVHASNARAFADFMGNHYARRVETATPAELREFLTEYYPRNAWPSDEQRAVVEQSLEHVFAVTETEPPEFSAARR